MKSLVILSLIVATFSLGISSCDSPAPQPPPVIEEPPVDEPPVVAECNATISRKANRSFAFERNATVQSRIVGGVDASSEEYPWVVALTSPTGFQYCGGSLVAPDWVLTAAHCMVQGGDIAVVGRDNLLSTEGEEIRIEYSLTHALYNSFDSTNDIALLKLSRPASQSYISIIPKDSPDITGASLTVVGWGTLREGGSTSQQLQQVNIPALSQEECRHAYALNGIDITDTMLCAGFPEGGKDSCQGDSGGPIVITRQDGVLFQAGIVSFGIGCARPGLPGVYTRVSEFTAWVSSCSDVELISFAPVVE